MARRESLVFAEFVGLRSAALHRSAYLIAGDADLARDLVVEALTRTWLAWRRLHDPREAEAYARRVITTTAIAGPPMRQPSPPVRPAVPRLAMLGADTVSDTAERAGRPEGPAVDEGEVDEGTLLWRAVLDLPVRQRAVVVLHCHEELTDRESAETMRSSIGSARRLLATGLAALGMGARGATDGSLRRLLVERADDVGFPTPDVDTVLAEADRRVRRRRTRVATGVVAVVVALVLAGGGLALIRSTKRPADVDTGGGLADPVTWSRGSTIHVGPDRIDAGVTIHGFVHTSSGFVLMDASRRVWSLTDSGRRRVGEVGVEPRLVADRNGPFAAWVDPDQALVVLDQRAGTTSRIPGPQRSAGGNVVALDGRTVYWRDEAGLAAVDIDSHRVSRLTDTAWQLFDVKSSMLAFTDTTNDLKVGPSLDAGTPVVSWSADPHHGDEPVTLSPTGRWVAVAHIRVAGYGEDQDIDTRLKVYDARTGAAVTLHLPGGPWVAVPSVWLGDASLQVLGLFGDPPFVGDTVEPSLFRCRVPSGTCERAAIVGRVGVGYAVATLPDGRWTRE